MATPVAARLCGFLFKKPGLDPAANGTVLSGPAARALAVLLRRHPATPSAACRQSRAALLIRFRTARGANDDVIVKEYPCPHGFAFVGSRAYDTSDLDVWESIAESAMQHGGPPTPDVFGLTAQHARRTADDDGFRPVYVGELVDDEAAFGTVVLQTPAPGEIDFLAGQPELDIDLAVSSHEQRCNAGQLRTDYYMQGPQQDHTVSATIKVRNVGTAPCALPNGLVVHGVDADGDVLATSRLVPIVAGVLSPSAHATSEFSDGPFGQMTLDMTISYFTEPTGDGAAPCTRPMTPAEWRAQFGAVDVVIANQSPHGPLSGCANAFGARVDPPS